MRSQIENVLYSLLERRLISLLFIAIYCYLIFRAVSVFYIHDELVTKWSYMINWNPLPSQGYVDANNHFLLSFLGGLFIRIFHSDSMLVVRLASLLAFPIYFWSIYSLKGLFRQKANFYGLLIGLVCISFILEYFALARGYGLSFAFMLLALQQTTSLYSNPKGRTLILIVFAWVLAITSNLTLIPFGLVGIVFAFLFSWKHLSKWWLIVPSVGIAPLIFLISYSFTLKGLGKLYYGGNEGFFETTIHTITPYIWNVKHIVLDLFLSLICLLIGAFLLRHFWKERTIFNPKYTFALFLFLAIGNILGQHWVLGINYPGDRTALYLVIFFIGAFFMTIDEVSKSRVYSVVYCVITIVFFGIHLNFNYSILHKGEHIDGNLVRLISREVIGTPPSTGGRWAMENEMNRSLNIPMRMFQLTDRESDTLVDYMVYTIARRPNLYKWYHPIYKDQISGQTLFERNHFLSRVKTNKVEHVLFGKSEFFNLFATDFSSPKLIRITGQINELNLDREIHIVFSSKDSISGETINYEAISIVQNMKIREDRSIQFDFSYALKKTSKSNQFAVYLWNKEGGNLSGIINVQVYQLGD